MKNEEKAFKLYNGITNVGEDLIEEAGTARKRKKMTPLAGGGHCGLPVPGADGDGGGCGIHRPSTPFGAEY